MKIISIHDHENTRVIVAQVPTYLTDISENDEGIAEAIFDALGISHSNCDWMMLEDTGKTVAIDVAVLNSGKGYGENTRSLDEFTQNFKEDALASLEDINA